jgi:hypothetical protein
LKFLDLGLCGLVVKLTHDRVEEVNPAKRTSDTRIDRMPSTWKLDLGLTANLWEHITLPHFDKSKLNIVAVSRVI